MSPGYFHRKIEEIPVEPKEIPSCLIPHLLAAFTQQLEILVTSLKNWIIYGVLTSLHGRFSEEKRKGEFGCVRVRDVHKEGFSLPPPPPPCGPEWFTGILPPSKSPPRIRLTANQLTTKKSNCHQAMTLH